MLRKSKLKLVMQSAATAVVIALSGVGAVGATTTIGTNISTDGILTVAGASTLQAAASITSTTNPQLSVKYDANNYWTEGVSSTGVVTLTRYGSALQKGFTLADTVAIASSTLQTLLTIESTSTSNASTTLAVYQFGTGDILNVYDGGTAVFTVKDGGTVGVGSSTPWGLLSVEMGTEARSFVVGNNGSSTPSFVVRGVNGNGYVGVATTTPTAMLSVGPGSNATTTIDVDKVCYRARTTHGSTFYWYWTAVDGGSSIKVATSTTSCF